MTEESTGPENPDKYWLVTETILIDGVYGKAKIKKWYDPLDGKVRQKILSFNPQN